MLRAAARRYVGGGGRVGGGVAHAAAASADNAKADDDEDDCCAICMLELTDAYDELGEPLYTSCGHRFHAVCLARHMESTEQDPSCPICRSSNLSVRFLGTR